MEKVTHIYVYGDIINFQVTDLEFWGCVSLTTVKDAYERNPECEEIFVHIHSLGGDVHEGFAIHDFLVNLQKEKGIKVTTVIEGLCCSIATVIFLAGSVRKITDNSRFLIHNPWCDAWGNADELATVVDFLREEQKKLVDFYVVKTGNEADVLQALMNEDILIDAAKALELKFATEVVNTANASAKALAFSRNPEHQKLIFNSIKKSMATTAKKPVKAKTKFAALKAAADAILKFFNEGEEGDDKNEVSNSSVTLEGGEILYFAEDTIAVGVSVFNDAELTEPASDGDHTQDNGDVIVVVSGVVDSITPANEETPEDAVARLTEENSQLNARITELEGENAQALTTVTDLTNAMAKVRSSGYKPEARKPVQPSSSSRGKQTPEDKGVKQSVKEFKASREASAKKA